MGNRITKVRLEKWPLKQSIRVCVIYEEERAAINALTPYKWFELSLWKVISDIRWEVFLKLNKVAEQYLQNNWA